jgi:hypothetical protein
MLDFLVPDAVASALHMVRSVGRRNESPNCSADTPATLLFAGRNMKATGYTRDI